MYHLHVPVDQPVELKVFVVVAEGVDQLLGHLEGGDELVILWFNQNLLILLHHRIMMIGHLEESHEEEELENSEDREVKVQVDWHPVPHYLINIWPFGILF